MTNSAVPGMSEPSAVGGVQVAATDAMRQQAAERKAQSKESAIQDARLGLSFRSREDSQSAELRLVAGTP